MDMASVLKVSRSGYYAWLRRPSRSRWQRADAALAPHIVSIHEESRGIYGAPRVQAELRARGIVASRHRITRLMSEQGLQGVSRRRNKSLTKRSSAAIPAQDLVQRQFCASSPNELWVADATYVPTVEGVLYLAIVLDVFARRIVGWSMAARQDSDLMVRALQMALTRRQPTQVVHHSDHGSQNTSQHFLEVCQRANVQVSMGSVGDCYDNAMAESFFATLETELIHQQPRRCFQDRTQAQAKIFD
ncbi:MAG: IS3 family transposase [Gammaproteobacteria bacterium]|nr:IS3 family transposase [Gammaproteobacteria bacterium]MYI76660.1 IS3 family transposase [Gammaproteobacteria bacterium]